MDQIMEVLTQATTEVLIALIGVASVFAMLYIKKLRDKALAEISKIENEDTQNYAKSVLDRVYDVVAISVDKMEVTLVKEIKATTEDGKLTKEDGERVANEAYKLFLDLASTELLSALEGIVGDTKTYLMSLIDSIVLEKKNDLLKAGVTSNTTTTTEDLND